MLDSFSLEVLEKHSHETPFFVFSKEKIIENLNKFENLYPEARIHYAMKSNSESEVLRTLYKAGANFEVASIYELQMLIDLDISPERIIYGTSVKPAAHIKQFFDYGVRQFAFDSLEELEKIAANAPHAQVYVRIVADDTGSVFKLNGKFGTPIENVVPFLKRAQELSLEPWGISFNVGSQAGNPRAWAETIETLPDTLNHLADEGIKIEILDIGGGHPHPYPSSDGTPTAEDIARHTLEAYQKLPYQPQLLIEPGRALIANAAVLITTIIARLEREGVPWLFLDAGTYNALFETMAYQGSTRYPIESLRRSYDSGEKLFTVTGPTGDSIDTITTEARLPADLNVGDKLVIRDVGAYTLVLASPFNGFPPPKVYFV